WVALLEEIFGRLSEFMERGAATIWPYSGLMLAVRMTLPHFSMSWAKSFPNSVGVDGIGTLPRSAIRFIIAGSARPLLISRLIFSMICGSVPFGAPIPFQVFAS